jgi:VIT1/CCC1 family predicted Fe2+/Mn2+ transporter
MQTNLASETDEAQSGGTRAAVLGINDGLVTNLSLILGVAGGSSDVAVVKLAGMASLVAGACSMAVGEFVSMQAQVQLLRRVLASVTRAFANDDERVAGVKRAFAREGLSDRVAAEAAVDLGDDCDKSADLFARVVLGINPGELGSPWVAAVASLVTFAIGAFVPLIPWYFFDGARAAEISIGGSVIAAFAIGALLGYHTDRRWLVGGIRQVIVIALAASVTYGAGRLFHTVVR